MPRSLKYAWRALATAGGAAMLMIAMPAAGNAAQPQLQQTPINICVNGKGFVGGINVPCRSTETGLRWNLAGPQGAPGIPGIQGVQGVTGAPGVVGAQGAAGAAGATGNTGQTGNPGPVGPTGSIGVIGGAGAQGATGATGPVGAPGLLGNQGVIGPQGPTGPTGIVGPTGLIGLPGLQGLQGPQGATGPTGIQGIPGAAGDETSVISGGTLGETIGLANGIKFSPVGVDFLGPGNGASSTSPNSVAVPVPAGTLSNLTVVLDTAPGPVSSGRGYVITVCQNSVCTGPTCTISGISTTCTAPGTQAYNDADTIVLYVHSVTGLEAPSNATWSANYTITNP